MPSPHRTWTGGASCTVGRMFIGHFATGLAAKPLAPRASLPTLLMASQAMDLAWPVLVATGVERAHVERGHLAASPLVLEYMPYSHSLVAALGWALLFALGYLALTRDRRGALVSAGLVVAHWFLDWASPRGRRPGHAPAARATAWACGARCRARSPSSSRCSRSAR
jgi:membrane-bound metal-dependent hydrolase YbcI (DUF457 family)